LNKKQLDTIEYAIKYTLGQADDEMQPDEAERLLTEALVLLESR